MYNKKKSLFSTNTNKTASSYTGLSTNNKSLFFINFKPLSLALVLAGASLNLSGCNGSEVKDLFEEATNSKKGEDETQFCYSKPAPFEHTLCSVQQSSLNKSDSFLSLRLFWKSGKWQSDGAPLESDKSRKPLLTFDNLLADLPENTQLKFAVNAGMYNNEFAPIGYTVMNGQQILSLNLNQGAGNFHLVPNGVLWWDKNADVHITESETLNAMLTDNAAKPVYATQSGPMLVINGKIHPKFRADSTSKKIRNGVGVCDDGTINFVTSKELVNFHQFAQYFKDELHCPNALFLDGGIASAVYAPELKQKDDKNMGVMVGLIGVKKDAK